VANLDAVIAVQLPRSDPAADIAAVCVAVGFVGGGIAWMMWDAGREARTSAHSPLGRKVGATSFQLGRLGLAIAAVLMITGAWVGLSTTSPADERRSQAQAQCKQDARGRHFTGQVRDDYIRQCVWERAD
jgi:hypothetical protein